MYIDFLTLVMIFSIYQRSHILMSKLPVIKTKSYMLKVTVYYRFESVYLFSEIITFLLRTTTFNLIFDIHLIWYTLKHFYLSVYFLK